MLPAGRDNMSSDERVLADVRIATRAADVWHALRDPERVHGWFGWDYDGLAAEIDPADARELAAAPVTLARRAVRRWLRHAGPGGSERYAPDAAATERVLAVARGEAVACELAGGWRVARREGRLRLEPPGQ